MATAKLWADPYRAEGATGMSDRSSRPHRSPTRTPRPVERRVLHLSRTFAEGLAEIGVCPAGPTEPGKLGPMVAVPVQGDAHDWQERLRSLRVNHRGPLF